MTYLHTYQPRTITNLSETTFVVELFFKCCAKQYLKTNIWMTTSFSMLPLRMQKHFALLNTNGRLETQGTDPGLLLVEGLRFSITDST
jgi:hypothetical protein